MGQKTHPHGVRVGIIKDWSSKWYADKKTFGDNLVEDNKIRKYVKKKLFVALTVGTLAIGAVAATAFTTRTVGSLRADEKEYSVTLNADNASTLLAQSTGGASFQFVAEGLTAAEGKLGTLAADGYIGLAEGYSLNNLDKVVVDVGLPC